jgi:hypothetical protein
MLGSKEAGRWLEVDLYESTKTVVESLVDDLTAGTEGIALQMLHRIAASGKSAILQALPVAYMRLGLGDGRQSVYENVIEALADLSVKLDVKHRVLCSALDILKESSRGDTQLELRPSSKIRILLSDLWDNEDHRKTAQEFMRRFTDRE